MSLDEHRQGLATRFCEVFPDEALRLLRTCPAGEAAGVLAGLPDSLQRMLLLRMRPETAARVLAEVGETRRGGLLRQLPTPALSLILRQTHHDLQQHWLAGLGPPQQARLRLLLGYGEDMVGAWVAQPLATTADTPAGEVPALVAQAGANRASPWVHVLDDQQRLAASLSIAACLSLPPGQPLGQCGTPPLPQLNGSTPLTVALAHSVWRTTDWVAVTDSGRQLIGELSHLRLRQVLGRHRREDEEFLRADLAVTLAEAYGASLTALVGAMVEEAGPAPPREGARQ